MSRQGIVEASQECLYTYEALRHLMNIITHIPYAPTTWSFTKTFMHLSTHAYHSFVVLLAVRVR